MPTQLTEHFTLEELTHSDTANSCGIDNTCPTSDIEANLLRVATVLEEIRTLCGNHPVIVSSGYRCDALNDEVGGAENSAHRYGLGADITIPEFGTPTDICNEIMPYLDELQIDQLIDETDSQGHRWVHVGLCEGEPRCECFQL
jgi:zinc D-Ala-D-Ala carboxypeptidase